MLLFGCSRPTGHNCQLRVECFGVYEEWLEVLDRCWRRLYKRSVFKLIKNQFGDFFCFILFTTGSVHWKCQETIQKGMCEHQIPHKYQKNQHCVLRSGSWLLLQLWNDFLHLWREKWIPCANTLSSTHPHMLRHASLEWSRVSRSPKGACVTRLCWFLLKITAWEINTQTGAQKQMGALSFLQPNTGCSLLLLICYWPGRGRGSRGAKVIRPKRSRRSWPSSGERHPSTTSKPN